MTRTQDPGRTIRAPLALQMVALLLGGLIVAQLATLCLTLLLPPKPPPQYRLEDVAQALRGGALPSGDVRPLVRTVRDQPPSLQSPGWLVSERSRRDLARMMGVGEEDVRLLFYLPLPFAGVGAFTQADSPPRLHSHPAQRAEPLFLRADYELQGPGGGGGFPGASGPGGGAAGGGPSGGVFQADRFPGAGRRDPTLPRSQRGPASRGGQTRGQAPARIGGRDPGGRDPGGAGRGGPVQTIDPPRNPAGGLPTLDPPRSQAGSPSPGRPGRADEPSSPDGPIPTAGGQVGVPQREPSAGRPAETRPPERAGSRIEARPDGRVGLPFPSPPPSLDLPRTAALPPEPAPVLAPPPALRTSPEPRLAAVAPPVAAVAPPAAALQPPSAAPALQAAPTVALAEPGVLAPAPLTAGHGASGGGWSLTDPEERSAGLFGLSPSPFVQGDFVAAVRTGPGHWVTVQPRPEPFPNTWQRRVLAWFALSLAIVAPLGLLFARRLAKPLEQFADAAERLGRDPSGPILPLGGPAEIGRAGRAFTAMQSRLKRFIEDRTGMVGAISHDLRTPLARMRFRVERAPAELRQGMLNDIGQMEEMISSVLVFIRDAQEPSTRERVDLRSIFECVVDDAALVGGDVVLEAGDPLSVEADPVGVQRVLTNLVDNALKYGRQAHGRMYRDGDDVVAEVVDSGPGLPPEELERVFLPFYRSQAARSLNSGGIGLGLAVSRSIARAHGGDVRLESPGKGVVAQLRLPVATAA